MKFKKDNAKNVIMITAYLLEYFADSKKELSEKLIQKLLEQWSVQNKKQIKRVLIDFDKGSGLVSKVKIVT